MTFNFSRGVIDLFAALEHHVYLLLHRDELADFFAPSILNHTNIYVN